jgi:hypothetical protein
MKFLLEKLEIRTKREPVVVQLSPLFTYIYGEITTGKSTVGRLIDYCLGSDMDETPALQDEFVSAQLYVQIESYRATFSREKNAQQVKVLFTDANGQEFAVVAPIDPLEEKVLYLVQISPIFQISFIT